MKKFLTSDLHAGELAAPNTHSFLRPRPTEVMTNEWIDMCHKQISSDDILYILGDLAVSLEDLKIYQQLPDCNKIIILGDKEYNNKAFSEAEWLIEAAKLGIIKDEWSWSHGGAIQVGDKNYFLAHKPTDCFANPQYPALCGHVHGIWRTQMALNGLPIINLGIDAWGGLVTEEFIEHQYTAIMKGYYDKEARVDLWTK